MMAMETKVMQIGPTMAKEMLSHNMPQNRRLNKDTVARYARIMRGGGWNLTHQGIAFDEAGNLIDGQHRLNAIVSAGVNVLMNVTRGVHREEGEAFTIDVGQKRTIGNIMQISGIDDAVYKDMAPIVSAYMRWKMPMRRYGEAVEIISYIDRHYEDIAKLRDIFGTMSHGNASNGGRRVKIPAFVGAALLAALYRGENEDALRKFCTVYRLNDVAGCEAYNPRHALNIRDFVRDHKGTTETFARVESAISAFAGNKRQLIVRDNHYPYCAELDA